MAYTQTDLDAVDAAIASGELRVSIDNRDVTYRSIDELMKARAFIAQNITANTGAGSARAYRYHFATSRE